MKDEDTDKTDIIPLSFEIVQPGAKDHSGGSTSSSSSREERGQQGRTASNSVFGSRVCFFFPHFLRFPQQQHLKDPLRAVHPRETISKLAEELGSSRDDVAVHEIWPVDHVGGRARILCGGRCVTGPPEIDDKFNLCAWTSILSPSIFFFVACCPDFVHTHLWFVILAATLFILTVAMAVLTSFTDPGIIPRPALQVLVPGLQEEVAKANGLEGKPAGEKKFVEGCFPDAVIMDDLEEEGYWWCRWCHMVQPPRAKHCRDCNCCVMREDHHCPFLNNCIGQRNYGFFSGFITSVVLYGSWVVFATAFWMVNYGKFACLGGLGKCWAGSPGEVFVSIFALLVVVFPGMLLVALVPFGCFHLVLILRGRTTREILTGRVLGEGSTLFAKRGPSLIRATQRIKVPQPSDPEDRS